MSVTSPYLILKMGKKSIGFRVTPTGLKLFSLHTVGSHPRLRSAALTGLGEE